MSADGEIRIEAEPSGAAKARHTAVLAELTELGLTLARDLHARALAADDNDEAVALSLSFQRVSRAVRQAVALEAKIERDAARDAREVQREVDRARAEAADQRRARVRTAVQKVIRGEADAMSVERLCDELDELIEVEAEAADFPNAQAGAVIGRICRTLGVSTPAQRLETFLTDRAEDRALAARLAEAEWLRPRRFGEPPPPGADPPPGAWPPPDS